MIRALATPIWGIVYFVLLYGAIERFIVGRATLTVRQGRLIDFVWLCTSGVSLGLLLLSTRETTFRDRIGSTVARAAASREHMIELSRTAADSCMAARWPPGAPVGKTYEQNGNRVTDVCVGVTSFSGRVSGFYTNDQLWRQAPSQATARVFDNAYRATFVTDTTWEPHIDADQATLRLGGQLSAEARSFFADTARYVVALESRAGDYVLEASVVHAIMIGTNVIWPFVLATAFAFRLGRARIDLRQAP